MRADTTKYKVLFKRDDGGFSSMSYGLTSPELGGKFGRRYYPGRTARMPYNQKGYGLLIFDSFENAQEFKYTLWAAPCFLIFRVATGRRVWRPAVPRWKVGYGMQRSVVPSDAPWPVGTLMTNCLRLVEEVKS